MIIQDLYIYPIKSLGGIRVESTEITPRGFRYDRRFMLVDQDGRFISQREHAQLALLRCSLEKDQLTITHKRFPERRLVLPAEPAGGASRPVRIWDDTVTALTGTQEWNQWFSEQLDMACQLVYMPEDSLRQVDLQYAADGDITSFSDGYPVLVIAQESLDLLNSKLETSVTMDRFRPNLVIRGTAAHAEDALGWYRSGDVLLEAVKPCARCVMTTIDQETGIAASEPLRTLSAYRRNGHKVLFGQNLLVRETGTLSVGDALTFTAKA